MQKDLDLTRPMFADLFVDEGKAGGLVKELGQRGAGPGDMIHDTWGISRAVGIAYLT